MKKDDLVSIIIPCYNHAEHLEETVNSAINQTYPNIEIIVINDGSSDNTQHLTEVLQLKHPEKIQVISQKNSGVSVARNNAIKQSKGKYILPLDADDLLDKTMISSCLETMIKYNADIICTDIQCFGVKNFIVKKLFSKDRILYQNLCSVSSLYRRKVWNRTKGYKKNMQEGYEDWEFWINAYNQGFTFQRHPETLLMYRTKKESRDTLAEEQDAYLKAKIVMNHPELYPIPQVQEAVTNIRKTEDLSDLYFYYDKDITVSEKMWITEVVYYIADHPLERNQIVQIDNKKVGLCTLELFKNSKSLQKLYEKMDVDFLLFYAPMRYKLAILMTSSFAWKKNGGITKAHGTLFPFVSKSKRENPKKQLIAYQRLLQYQTKIYNDQQLIFENNVKTLIGKKSLIEKKDALLDQQKVLIDNQNKTIEEKGNLLQKEQEKTNQNNNKIKTLMSAIQKITEFSIIKSPINKYKAYKMILKIYYQLRSSK